MAILAIAAITQLPKDDPAMKIEAEDLGIRVDSPGNHKNKWQRTFRKLKLVEVHRSATREAVEDTWKDAENASSIPEV